MTVRKARIGDLAEVAMLMASHAASEHYEASFALDEQTLKFLGFDRAEPAFHLFVCEGPGGDIVGYALAFVQHITFRNRPMFYLNDLMVSAQHRREGIARALMEAVCREAWALGCFRVKWGVANNNAGAIAFYEDIGAVAETGKQYFLIDLPTEPLERL